jgi:hypothetical protein
MFPEQRSTCHWTARFETDEQVRDAQPRGVDPGGDIMVHGIRNGLGWLGSLQQRVDGTPIEIDH